MQHSNLRGSNRNKPSETYKFFKSASCCVAVVEWRISYAKFDRAFFCLRRRKNRDRIRGFARSLRSSKCKIRCRQNCVSQILMRFGAFMHERFPRILQERYCDWPASFFCRNEFQKIPFDVDANCFCLQS